MILEMSPSSLIKEVYGRGMRAIQNRVGPCGERATLCFLRAHLGDLLWLTGLRNFK